MGTSLCFGLRILQCDSWLANKSGLSWKCLFLISEWSQMGFWSGFGRCFPEGFHLEHWVRKISWWDGKCREDKARKGRSLVCCLGSQCHVRILWALPLRIHSATTWICMKRRAVAAFRLQSWWKTVTKNWSLAPRIQRYPKVQCFFWRPC